MEAKRRFWIWVVIVVGVGLAARTGINVWRLWKLGGRLTEAQKQLAAVGEENRSLSARLEYVKSPDFVEKEARDKFGFGKAGETIVVVPDEDKVQGSKLKAQERGEANWRKWVKLYTGF